MKSIFKVGVTAAVIMLFAASDSFAAGFTVYTPGSGMEAGDTFNATIRLDSGSNAVKSYRLRIQYRSDVIKHLSAEGAVHPELDSPITADFFFASSVVVMDTNNYSMGCSTMGIWQVAELKFLVLDSAGSSVGSPLEVSVEEVIACNNEDITSMFVDNFDGNTIINMPVASTNGVTQYLDLNGDGYFTNLDAQMMFSLVEDDIANTSNMGVNAGGLQADINGNGLADEYDYGFMKALTQTVSWCSTGNNGIADTIADFMDIELIPFGQGRPDAIGIIAGANEIVDSIISGDDFINGYYVSTGLDGIMNSFPSGDDIQQIPYGNGFPNAPMIEPGSDETLDSLCAESGDDNENMFAMDTQGLLQGNQIPGAPARLVKVSPKQDPFYVRQYTDFFDQFVRSPSVPLIVRVEDEDGNPRVGIAPTFLVVQGSGYFDGPAGSSAMVNGLISDHGMTMGESPKGNSQVVFHPSMGNNIVAVSLPADPSKGVAAPQALFFNINVVSALITGGFPDSFTIEPGSRDVSLGDSTVLTMTLTNQSFPVHGMQDRIVMVSDRNMKAGFSPFDFGVERLSTVFYDMFEDTVFPDSTNGMWQIMQGASYINRDVSNPGIFGTHSMHFTPPSISTPVTIQHQINTIGYRDIELSYQWAYSGTPVGGDYMKVEYSTNGGSSWREIQYSSGQGGLFCPLGACSGKMTLETRNLSGDSSAENNANMLVRFTFASSEGGDFWFDNLVVKGLKVLFEESFEGYSVGMIPGGYDSPSRVTSGPNGIAQTTAQTGDTQAIAVGNGFPNSVCVYPSLDDTLQTEEGGDDVRDAVLNLIDSGANGVCETTALGDDFQNIPYGQGKPFSEIISSGEDNYLNTTAILGDDRKQSLMGPNPQVVVDSTIGSNPGGSQGNDGSQKFLKIGRATSGGQQDYVFRKIIDVGGYENVWLYAYTKTLDLANVGGDELGQKWVCEVSDNGGETFIPVWNASDTEENSWERHKVCLSCDERIHMVDGLIVQWRARLNSHEDDTTDPDAAYIDDIFVVGTPVQPDVFGPVVDTYDGMGHYTASITSISPGTARVSAYLLPYDFGEFPLNVEPDDFVNFNFRKIDPKSVRVLPDTFTIKACESMDFTVVGHYADQPGTIVDDVTPLYNLEVFGPAQIDSDGHLIANCFSSNDILDIHVNAVPKVAGLYDPGGEGEGQQTGYLSGKVFSSVFPYPGLNGSRVRVEGSANYSTGSGSDGSYLKSGVPVGTYTVKAFKSSYIMDSVSNVTITSGATTTLNLFQDGGSDTDGDTTLDSSDTDDDDDGKADASETTAGTTLTDPDTDADGYGDNVDAFPTNANEYIDTDSDGTGNNTDTDDDGDGISDSEENIAGSDGYVTNPLLTDTDGDTLGDYAEVNTYLTDPSKADTDGGGRADGAEIAMGKNPAFGNWNDDDYAPTASAGSDSGYATSATAYLDGRLTSDPDGDSINYTWVQLAGPATMTIGNSSTSFANFSATYPGIYTFSLQVKDVFTPQMWGSPDNVIVYVDADSDSDGLPNNFESVLGSNSSSSDSDSDMIDDLNEFWNPTLDISATDSRCYSETVLFGLYCWGDTDNNGVVGLSDVSNLNNYSLLKVASFPNVYPTNANTMDLNGDTTAGVSDATILKNWILLKTDGSAKPPTTLTTVIPSSSPTVPIGGTQTITLQVKNANAIEMSGVGVVFTISGNGELLGGRGSAAGLTDPDGGTFASGSRWDVSGTISSGGYVTMTVRVTGSGQITVNAKIPPNASKGLDSSVQLSSPVIINP